MQDVLLSGWVGGVAGCLAAYPFDSIKTLMQYEPQRFTGFVQTTAAVIRTNGPVGLYRGVIVPTLGTGVLITACFLAYEVAERVVRRLSGQLAKSIPLTVCQVIACGASVGVLSACLQGPAELIKIRQQTTLGRVSGDGSLCGVIKRIYTENGIRGFLRGVGVTMCRDVPGTAVWFGAYEATKVCMCTDPTRPKAWQSLLAGGIGGMAMWLTVMPVDVVKTRLQASSARLGKASPQPWQIIRAMYMQQGVRTFYIGLGPTLMRAMVGNGATFAGRDITIQCLRGQ